MGARTEFVYFTGKAKYARVVKPDEWSNWKITLYPNPDSVTKILQLKEEGLKSVLRKDDEGYNITIKRPTSKLIRGSVVGFAPPEVLQSDGKTPLTESMIGNGSDVTVKVEVYSYKSPQGNAGKAMRLASIRVDNLVPFVVDRDFQEDQKTAIRGLPEQPVTPVF